MVQPLSPLWRPFPNSLNPARIFILLQVTTTLPKLSKVPMTNRIVLMLLFSPLLMPNVQAQEVIMNQPSADVVDKGKLFVRSDSFYTQDPAFFEQNLNVAYGIFKNFEVSLNGVDVNHTHTQVVVVPGFKWAVVKKRHFEFYVGDQYWRPVANNNNNIVYHNGNVAYEAGAVTVGNWRFTAGAFQSHNAYSLGNRAGAISGIEYSLKVSERWTLVPAVDYASGAGINGYTSPGLGFLYKSNSSSAPVT